MMMKVQVLLFGELAQIAGLTNLELNNVANTNEASEQLLAQFPVFRNKKYAIAVNKQIIKDSQQLNDGDELALLPPFSGG